MPSPLSFVSAGALAALTLGVFSIQARTGPEATLKQFHQLLMQGNPKVANLMVEPISFRDNQSREYLVQVAYQLVKRSNGQIEFFGKDIHQRTATVTVQYRIGQSLSSIVYVMQYTRGAWKVDSTQTLNANAVAGRSG
ncbi:MAG: hypothetical protein JST40_01815 [Armatimonadetes bacterium]|nr:hypothetical protein [Armatimonadota bacterium]